MEMPLPIAGWTALACAVIFLALTVNAIRLRRGLKVAYGDGGHRVLEKAIRGQANAAEQMPIALIVLGLAEMQGAPGAVLLPGAVALVLGRALHGAYFLPLGLHWRWRFYGMATTLTAQSLLILALLIGLL